MNRKSHRPLTILISKATNCRVLCAYPNFEVSWVGADCGRDCSR